MKNLICLILIGIFLNPGFLLAQEQTQLPQDTIYLTGGGMMVGTILRYHPKKGVVIKSEDGVLSTIAPNIISKMTMNTSGEKDVDKANVKLGALPKPYEFQEIGFYYSIAGSMLNGIDAVGDSEIGFGLQATGGYMFHRFFGVGLGAGFDNYSTINNNAPAVFPVSLEVRGYLTQQNRAPYYSLSGGYGFAAKDEERGIDKATGGAMFHPAFGVRLGAREDVNFSFDFGYRFQRVEVERTLENWRREVQEQRIWYKRFVLRFGIIF